MEKIQTKRIDEIQYYLNQAVELLDVGKLDQKQPQLDLTMKAGAVRILLRSAEDGAGEVARYIRRKENEDTAPGRPTTETDSSAYITLTPTTDRQSGDPHPAKVREQVKKLAEMDFRELLKKDPEYRRAIEANIEMAFVDNARWHKEKKEKRKSKSSAFLNQKDLHTIGNKAAKYFLDLFLMEPGESMPTSKG